MFKRNLLFILFSLLLSFFACTQKHKVHILPNDEIYTCKEHIHVIDDHPAKCPFDGSDLIKKKIIEEQRKMLENGDFDRAKE